MTNKPIERPTARYSMFLDVPKPIGIGPMNPTKAASVLMFSDLAPDRINIKTPQ